MYYLDIYLMTYVTEKKYVIAIVKTQQGNMKEY